jgi:hypothetical protein
VTLRDEKVREAIFHCWELQQHGGQLRFQFRYITRGEATVEAGKPFGADNAGLELWSTAASALQDAVNVQARGIDPLEQMDFKIFSTRNCRAGTVAANTWLFTRIPGGTAGKAMWLRRALS